MRTLLDFKAGLQADAGLRLANSASQHIYHNEAIGDSGSNGSGTPSNESNQKLLLGRQASVEQRAALGQGQPSVAPSTEPKAIFKQNYRDIRAAKEIEFDTRGVPKTLEEILLDTNKGGQFSRAEKYMIDTRQDIRIKTKIIEEEQ